MRVTENPTGLWRRKKVRLPENQLNNRWKVFYLFCWPRLQNFSTHLTLVQNFMQTWNQNTIICPKSVAQTSTVSGF